MSESPELEERLADMEKKSKVLAILKQIYGEWSSVVWVLRLYASAVSGDANKCMFTYFFGPGGSGKDTVVLLLTTLLGTKRSNYTRFLKKGYFLKETSPESPSPFLCGLVGARWVVCTEIPKKVIIPDNLKDLTECQGAELVARGLYSDPISFHPMFRLVIMSNHEFIVPNEDTGIERRHANLTHTKLFKSNPVNQNHIQSDPTIKKRIKKGEFVHEVFALLKAFIPSLNDVPGDLLLPLPESQQHDKAEGADDAFALDSVAAFLRKDIIETCEPADATKADLLRNALASKAGTMKNPITFMTEVGLEKKKNFVPSKYYYGFMDKDGVWHAVRLKAVAPAPATSSANEQTRNE